MRKIATLAAALILTILISTSAIAQSSPNSTPAAASPVVTKTAEDLTPEQTIAILIADLKELRKLHTATKEERDAAVAALESEKAERASLERSYASAEQQIATLNRSIQHLERAIALHEKTIAMVEKQRDEAKAEAKRSKKQAVGSILLASAVLAAKFFGLF